MINAERRGELAGAELAKQVDTRLSRYIILPSILVWLLAKVTFARFKRQGYAYIEPESDFVHGFVTRFERERTLIFD